MDIDGGAVARHVIVTSSDAYVSAFAKSLTDVAPVFDSEEVAAQRLPPDRARQRRRLPNGQPVKVAVSG